MFLENLPYMTLFPSPVGVFLFIFKIFIADSYGKILVSVPCRSISFYIIIISFIAAPFPLGFRPLPGSFFLYLYDKLRMLRINSVSVPYRGLFFYITYMKSAMALTGGVFPSPIGVFSFIYDKKLNKEKVILGFRPLSGSFLLYIRKGSMYSCLITVSVPYRGLFFYIDRRKK